MSRGGKSTAERCTGSSARAQPRHSPDRRASSAAPWPRTLSSSKASSIRKGKTRCIRPFTELDESPMCYKRLPEVLAAHANTIKILHVLTPVGVAMAGKWEHDPFKD